MKKIIYSLLILAVAGVLAYVLEYKNQKTEIISTISNPAQNENKYTSYKNPDTGPEFIYPVAWGEVAIKEGNKNCPEEDTYRTLDTLNVFDWEYSFSEMKLPNSESMIRTGIRTRELDSNNLNTCGDEFFYKVSTKELDPRVISSVRLEPITLASGLSGIYTSEASRLNTESRRQYTFFLNKDSKIYVIQSYMSFIPYFNSPELKEIEEKFGGDMQKYLEQGITSENIREKFKEFRVMSESLKFSSE